MYGVSFIYNTFTSLHHNLLTVSPLAVVQPDILQYHPYTTYYTPVRFASDSSLTGPQRDRILRTEAKQFDDLLEISVQLPATVCWWTPPLVVRWQPWEQSDEFRAMHQELQDYNLNYAAVEEARAARLFNRVQVTSDDPEAGADLVMDIDLGSREEAVRLFYVMTKHIVPRLSLTYQFECEVHEEAEKLTAELKRREHLKQEFAEDVKLRREQAIARRVRERRAQRLAELLAERAEKRAAERAERRAAATATGEDGDEGGGVESEPEPDDDDDAPTLDTIDIDMSTIEDDLHVDMMTGSAGVSAAPEAIEFKNIVQGAAARELYPRPLAIAAIEIRPNPFRFSPATASQSSGGTAVRFLSDLLREIEAYNLREVPVFKVKSQHMRASDERTPSDSESDAEKAETAAGRTATVDKGRSKSTKSTRRSSMMSVRSTVKPTASGSSTAVSTTSAAAHKSRIHRHRSNVYLVPHARGKWVTDGIYVQRFDEASKTITFKTTHIGKRSLCVCVCANTDIASKVCMCVWFG